MRIILLSTALAAVIGLIVYMQQVTPPETAAPTPSGADARPGWESELIRSAAAPSDASASKITHTVRDKRRRDEIRELIYKAYGMRAPAAEQPKPKSGAALHAPLGADAGKISPEYVQARIREDFVPLAKQCYEAAIERDAGKAGKLVLSFVIVGDEEVGGIVESAETVKGTTLDDEELVTCLRESMLSMSFEPPENGGSVSVTYPFVFSPDDAG